MAVVKYKESYRRYRRYYRHLRVFYKKPAVRDFTFLVLTLLTIAFFTFFAIKPSLKTIGGLIKEIKDKRHANEMLAKKINALALAQREYASLQSDLPVVLAVLPFKNDSSRLAKQIEYLARKNSLFILSFQIEKATLFADQEEAKVLSFKFDLHLGGEYQDLKKFIKDLGKIDRLITMESFSFSKKKSGRRELEIPLSLRIQGLAYFLR